MEVIRQEARVGGDTAIRKTGLKFRMVDESSSNKRCKFTRRSSESSDLSDESLSKEQTSEHERKKHHLYPEKESQVQDMPSKNTSEEFQTSPALSHLPSELAFCISSIPRAGLGVVTRRHMPAGTVIGPFEGRVVLPENVTPGTDTSRLWEVYKDNRIIHFLDGSDERFSCWMRHIQRAGHTKEQNLDAFQYRQNIYYRARVAIQAGTELLVWYENSYPNFIPIPYGLKYPRFEGHYPAVKVYSDVPRDPSTDYPEYYRTRAEYATGQKHVDSRITVIDRAPEATRKRSPPPSVGSPPPKTSSNGDESPAEPSSPRAVDYTEWNLWKCGMCHKTFTQRIMLQMHVCSSAPIKPYQCGHCNLAFTQPNELRHHMVTHTTEKPFKCGFCSRTFAGATTLHNHIRTHTGDKPFACDECGQSFSQAAQLSKHQKTPSECPGH